MPVVVGPSPLPLGTPVTSVDGYLTCQADPNTASVLIKVNFRGVTGGTPDRVTVTRTVAGVTRPVRGLDYYTAPGGVTASLDHYAPLGVTATYQAAATNSIAGGTWTSAAVTLLTPVASARRGWVKSCTRPSLSVNIVVNDWPDWSYDIPQAAMIPLGARYPTVSEGTRQAGTGQVTVGTATAAEMRGLQALLQLGGDLLLQAEAVHGASRPDVYVRAGALQQVAVSSPNPWRRWTFPVIEIAEPPTAGVSIPLPGHTFGDSQTRWPLFSNRTGTFLDRLTT